MTARMAALRQLQGSSPAAGAVANIGSTFGGVTGGAKIRNRLYAVETSKSLISYFPS